MNKKAFILTLIMGIATFALLLSYFILLERKDSKRKEKSSELGEITIEEQEVSNEDNYEGDADYEIDVKEYYVGFTNLNLVYDVLTLDAISALPDDAALFLNQHGYGDVHSLTIIEESIVLDPSYPYFVCTLDGISGAELEVRYDLSKATYEFAIIKD